MVGERVKNVRKSKNLTQQAFAKVLATSSGFISEVENGIKMPGFDLLLSLKREFADVDMNWLLTGEGEMKQAQPVIVSDKPEEFKPIPLNADRQHGVLHDKLQRVLNEGDKVKVDAVKGMLKAFDPGEKKQGVDCSENEGAGAARDRAA